MEAAVEKVIVLNDPREAADVFGEYDRNVRLIEDRLGVKITNRNNEIRIYGAGDKADTAYDILKKLIAISDGGDPVSEQSVRYLLDLSSEELNSSELPLDLVCVTYRGKPVKSKTYGQKRYIEALRKYPIVFGIGPAGTGKTFLAVAQAVKSFREKTVSRIILTRPAVEAGERLGFLPGDLQTKVDPYLRPLYDAMYYIMGPEAFHSNLEKGAIEIAPLAYMRGRTLDDSFIILDEAQNTTPEQMKMFLTRIGAGSRAVITGDVTQVDLPGDKKSGLIEAQRILEGVEGLAFVTLTEKDVVRHELVQRIIMAYDRYEKMHGKRRD